MGRNIEHCRLPGQGLLADKDKKLRAPVWRSTTLLADRRGRCGHFAEQYSVATASPAGGDGQLRRCKLNLMKTFVAFASFLVAMVSVAFAQSTSHTEVGSDGITYRVTDNTWQQSVPYTEMESRTKSVYQPQQTTQVQSYQQTYAVPVTEYRWVQRLRGWWNPLTPAYYSHHLEPVTRWNYQSATVQVPVTSTNWVAATQTTQVPVTKYRTVSNTSTTRVAISAAPSSIAPSSLGPQSTVPVIASRPAKGPYGSVRIENDPPREPSRLADRPGAARY